MNYYVITTTSGDQWETSKGVYIVSESTAAKARKKLSEDPDVPTGHRILSTTKISCKKPKVIFKQSPVFE